MLETINQYNNHSAKANIFQVIKKSGIETVFVEQKLQRSIEKALSQAGIEAKLIAPQLTDDVMKKLEEELSYRENISTLDIREAVEISFLERGLTKAASYYHDFVSGKSVADNDVIVAEPVLEEESKPTDATDPIQVVEPAATELPNECTAMTYKFDFVDVTGYVIVNLFSDGRPGEIILHLIDLQIDLDLNKLTLFLDLINISLKNNVSLNILLDRVLAFQSLKSDQEIMLLQHICEWLNKKF